MAPIAHDSAAHRADRRVPVSWVSLAVLAAAAAPRIWAAVRDHGVLCPEEIYETMEPAHRLAFGWGLVAPELSVRAHSWVFPGLLALVWKSAALAGLRSPERLMELAKMSMAALSLASVWLAMGLARRLRGESAAVITGLFAAACPPLVAFGSRPFAEAASAPLLVGAALLLERRTRRDAGIAGALIGCAALLRYETLVLGAGLIALLLARRLAQQAQKSAMAATAVIALGGLIDWPTLGAPYRSLITALRTSILGAHPSRYSRAELLYYPEHLDATLGVSLAVLLLGLALASGRARGLTLVVIAFLLAHMCMPKPELRFLTPGLPIAIAVSAVGLSRLFGGLAPSAWPGYAVTFACAAQMAWIAQGATRGQLGFGTSDTPIWHSDEDYLRETWAASATPDLCGAIFADNDPRWTGGYTYLHRAVPVYFDTRPDHLDGANAIVGSVAQRLPATWRRVSAAGRVALWQRPGSCTPPPAGWSMTLP